MDSFREGIAFECHSDDSRTLKQELLTLPCRELTSYVLASNETHMVRARGKQGQLNFCSAKSMGWYLKAVPTELHNKQEY